MMNLDELIALQDKVDQLTSNLKQALVRAGHLNGRLSTLRNDLTAATERLEQATQHLQASQKAEQCLPAERQAVQELQDQLFALNRPIRAMETAVTALNRLLIAWPPRGNPTLQQLTSFLTVLNKVRPDLPAQVQKDIVNLRNWVMAGTVYTRADAEALLTSWNMVLTELRTQNAAANEQLARQLAQAQQQLATDEELAAQRPAAEAAFTDCQAEVTAKTQMVTALQAQVTRLENNVHKLQVELSQQGQNLHHELDNLLARPRPDIPIALLPVRLETRYLDKGAGAFDLCIRIYPDDIAQDSFQPTLSDAERQHGDLFWRQINAADSEAEKLVVWNRLVERFGPGRAAWIADQMGTKPTPTNPNDAKRDLHVYARCFPDRFVALGYAPKPSGGLQRTFTSWGRLIKQPVLSTLLTSKRSDENWMAGIDKEARWLVDFEAAEQAGMAIRVALDADTPQSFEQLLVLGVRATLTQDESVQILQKLLETHHYTWGLSFLAQGVPTNNTGDATSGFQREDAGSLSSYENEMKDHIALDRITETKDFDLVACDGAFVGEALGLVSEGWQGYRAFRHISRSDTGEQRSAANMNCALWPATGGYFLRQLMRGVYNQKKDITFPGSFNLENWRQYFLRYVRGRGPLPTMRVGRQPYGLLPVTSLDSWQSWRTIPPEKRGQDFILFTAAAPAPTSSSSTLRIIWDLHDQSPPMGWEQTDSVPSQSNSAFQAGGLALVNLCQEGRRDLICLQATGQASTLVIGRNLRPSGKPDSWSSALTFPLPVAGTCLGAGVAVADFNADGRLDVAIVRFDQFSQLPGGGVFGSYLMAFGLQPEGAVDHVSQPVVFLPRSITPILAASAVAADVNHDGQPELIVFYITKRGALTLAYLQILTLNQDGSLKNVGSIIGQPQLGQLFKLDTINRIYGAGLTVDESAPPGRCDLLLCLGIESAAGQPSTVSFARGVGLTPTGAVSTWQPLGTPITMQDNGQSQAAQIYGMAAGQIGRSSTTDLRQPTGAVNTLTRLRDRFWQVALDNGTVPHVNVKPEDLNKNILRMLAHTALPSQFKLERLLSAQAIAHLWQQTNPSDPRAQESYYRGKAEQRIRQFLNEIGQSNWNPKLFEMIYLNNADLDPYAITLVADHPSETKTLPQDSALLDFLQKAASLHPNEIHNKSEESRKDREIPLLLRLLYVSTLWAYIEAATLVFADYLVEPDIVPDDVTITPWRYLVHLGPTFGGLSLADILFHRKIPDGLNTDLKPAFAYLDDYFASLQRLAELPEAELERLLLETLDLFAHRLDAWITSVATQRLREMRRQTPVGIYLGSYGWVEKLAPRSPNRLASGGYIHAPSPAQAATAAILRSGYLSHDPGGSDSSFAVNLSSRRVRRALELVDGVRQGLSLGQLLGYRLERTMRGELGRYIQPLRNAFPLTTNKLIRSSEPVEAVAANHVIDGLRLARAYQQDQERFLDAYRTQPNIGNLPAVGTGEFKQLTTMLDQLLDMMDALNDLGLAEAVYQAVQGNYTRSSASLEALGSGEVSLPEPEVVQTPRTGSSAAHRLVMLFSTSKGAAPNEFAAQGWRDGPRAQAEPLLNEFAARLLGDPHRVCCQATFTDLQSKKDSKDILTINIYLDELGLCPLDIIYTLPVGSEAGYSELEQRLAYHALLTARPATLDPQAAIGVQLTFRPEKNGENWPKEMLSFPEFLEVARMGRELITSVRALNASDLLHPQADAQRIIITPEAADEMMQRSTQAVAQLRAKLNNLKTLLDMPWAQDDQFDLSDPSRRKSLGDALLALLSYGLSITLPVEAASAETHDWPVFIQYCRTALKLAAERLAKLPETSAIADLAKCWEIHTKCLQTIFGEGFRVMPVFSMNTLTGNEWQTMLKSAFEFSSAQGATAEAIYTWFHRLARVRSGVARLHDALMYQEALSPKAARQIEFKVAQLPFTNGSQKWVGITAANGQTAIVAFAPQPLDLNQPLLAGLLLDNWVDVVPNSSETTAVSFHYDAPGVVAPQAMLLAVSPDPTQPWDLATLEAVLTETLNLARLRAVRLYDIPGIAHYLPALFVAQNTEQDTISFRD